MDSWIWIVLLVGLFWFMHRSGMGCCGGRGHGHGKGSDEHEEHNEADRMSHREEDQKVAEELMEDRR